MAMWALIEDMIALACWLGIFGAWTLALVAVGP